MIGLNKIFFRPVQIRDGCFLGAALQRFVKDVMNY